MVSRWRFFLGGVGLLDALAVALLQFFAAFVVLTQQYRANSPVVAECRFLKAQEVALGLRQHLHLFRR